MTKRTNQTKLTIYRRHAPTCPVAGQPNNVTNCECPLWIHGKLRGKFIRQSLDTRTLATAEARKSDLLNGPPNEPGPGGPVPVGGKPVSGTETLDYAAVEFLKTTAKLAVNTQILYRRTVLHFAEWAAKQELVTLRSIDSSHIRQYFESFPDWNATTAQNRLVLLRIWFNYCHKQRRWLTFPPTQDRTLSRGKKMNTSTRLPFTPAEIYRIFAAVEEMPTDVRDRARALVYLLLYTGMRISDATFCERSYLTPQGNMDYFVIKTRRPISLPPELQQPAIDALAKLPPTRVYFFQPDVEGDYRDARTALREGAEFSTLMPGYMRRIHQTTMLVAKVLEKAGLDGLCHRFRDSFAINLLVGDGENGADIFTVSKMLGHSDVKITDHHYMKLVPGYRERMSKATRVLNYRIPMAS